MILDSPMPFTEAIHKLATRALLPTDLSSAELRDLSRAIRDRSFFSARTLNEDYLAAVKQKITDILNPTSKTSSETLSETSSTPQPARLDYATARTELKQLLKTLGYSPEADKLGSLEDLASDKRLNLVLRTNTETAQGYGNWRAGQDETILDAWPAQELFRAEDRDVPRGTRRGARGLIPDPENSWQSRWNEAGEATGREDGWTRGTHRMVALKNHPIWEKLGDSTLFDDGLDNPYPPFAFNSGMDVEDVTREEAVDLGLIDENTQIEPQREGFELPEAALT